MTTKWWQKLTKKNYKFFEFMPVKRNKKNNWCHIYSKDKKGHKRQKQAWKLKEQTVKMEKDFRKIMIKILKILYITTKYLWDFK